MAIPYHTHNFEIPTASKQDILAGVATDKAVVPAALGSAAVEDISAFATAKQGIKADSAVQPARQIKAGTGLVGGGDLSADRTVSLSADSIASLNKANSAVQADLLGQLAYKNTIVIDDMMIGGAANADAFLAGDGTWKTPSGGGDMLAKNYDPQGKKADAFLMDHMVEGENSKIMTLAERETIAKNTNLLEGKYDKTGGEITGNVTINSGSQAPSLLINIPDGENFGGGIEFSPQIGGKKTQISYLKGGGLRVWIDGVDDVLEASQKGVNVTGQLNVAGGLSVNNQLIKPSIDLADWKVGTSIDESAISPEKLKKTIVENGGFLAKTITLSDMAHIDIDLADMQAAGCTRFEIDFDEFITTTNTEVSLLVSTDRGNVFMTSGYNARNLHSYGGSKAAGADIFSERVKLLYGNTAGGIGAYILNVNIQTRNTCRIFSRTLEKYAPDNGNAVIIMTNAIYPSDSVNFVRIYPSSGTVKSAKFVLKGFIL